MDILFKNENWVFSYRVAGICIRNGKVLLQKPVSDTAYAFPGGHVAFGESNAETLIREFREEIGADVSVGDLKWVAEIFFPWGSRPCHQICLYYLVEIEDASVTEEASFPGIEERGTSLEFFWVPVEETVELEVYPVQTPELLQNLDAGVQHFVYRE